LEGVVVLTDTWSVCRWDGAESTPCCGTNVIFSRKCLTEIGGFVYGSVTEDFLTSMYLHNKVGDLIMMIYTVTGCTDEFTNSAPSQGFKTKYVHEYLARGLSPDNLHDFMKQRFRWAAGKGALYRDDFLVLCR
jgi:cellulose synthase (UDP-forming)